MTFVVEVFTFIKHVRNTFLTEKEGSVNTISLNTTVIKFTVMTLTLSEYTLTMLLFVFFFCSFQYKLNLMKISNIILNKILSCLINH